MRHIMTFLTFIFCATIVFGQQAELITQQRIRGEITDFKFSPDGQYIANISKEDPSIHVWHLASEKIIGSLQDHEEGVKIGRASCRERVEIAESAVWLK